MEWSGRGDLKGVGYAKYFIDTLLYPYIILLSTYIFQNPLKSIYIDIEIFENDLIIDIDMSFPHHYQGRSDFNTVNPVHSTGMDLMSIPASKVVLTNPIPRDKIFQSYP